MDNKEEYNIKCFLEDGTPLSKENARLSCINIEVSHLQQRRIFNKIREMPKDVGMKVYKRLIGED